MSQTAQEKLAQDALAKINVAIAALEDIQPAATECLDAVEAATKSFSDSLEGATSSPISIATAGAIQKRLSVLKVNVDLIGKPTNKALDAARRFIVPAVLDLEDISSTRIDGLGLISPRSDIYIKINDMQGVEDWLEQNNQSQHIRTTVNASALKKLIKTQMSNPDSGMTALPEGVVNVTPHTYTVILK